MARSEIKRAVSVDAAQLEWRAVSAGTRRVEPRFASHLVGPVRWRRTRPRPAGRSSLLAGVGYAVLAHRGETAQCARRSSSVAMRHVPSPLECRTTRLRFRLQTVATVLTRHFLGGRKDGLCGHCIAEHDNVGGRFLDGLEEGGPCAVLLLVVGEEITRKRKVNPDRRARGVAHRARSARADTSRWNPDGGRTRACRRTAKTCTLRGPRSGRRDAIARGLIGQGKGKTWRKRE